jgi:hypothetical protein
MEAYKIIRVNKDTSLEYFVIEFPEGKNLNTIQDAIFVVKEKDSDDLGDALISKTIVGGGITIKDIDLAEVSFTLEDYDNLEIDVLYRAAFFVKWVGQADYDENVERLFDFQVIQNFHNDN